MKLACTLGLLLLGWLSFAAIPLWATENSDKWATHFQTPTPYPDKARYDVILGVKDANELIVRLDGETEKDFDYIDIYDSNGEMIKTRLSGRLADSFSVLGDHIRLVFVADGRKNKEGFQVSVKSRSPVELFQEIKRQLLSVIDHILRQGTKTAQNQLSEPLIKLNTLNKAIQNASDFAAIMNQVSTLLNNIAYVYQEIASQQPHLAEDHQVQFQHLHMLMAKTANLRENTLKHKKNYLNKLDVAQNKLMDIGDVLERKKAQYSINGYQSIISALETQEGFWQELYETQQALYEKLQTHSQKIMVLLHYLKISAQVNHQVADVASLSHNKLMSESTLKMLRNLTDLSELTQIIHDIEVSERDLQSIENNIEQKNFGS